MASISKLSVRGIRAFSPDDEEQVISFCFPLTIIIGANGCGKTTIIEALKYSVTGGLPTGKGHAFVHDPKSAGSSVVKAGIKLRFTNRAGKSMVVVRSMELTQKKKTMTFKALDGILRTTDEMGNRQSLSHKCSELDRQIPQLLGVSKSILEHVVFCHQEDSSWPLMEGAVLKKRFDDIFDSTRYVKALEAIKDTRKAYQNKVKDLKGDLGLLNAHLKSSIGFRQEVDKTSEALSDVFDEISEFDEKIVIERKRYDRACEITKEKESFDEEADQIQISIEKEAVRISEQRKLLRKDLTESTTKDELEEMLRKFDAQMEIDMKLLEEANDRIEKIKSRIKKLQGKKVNLTEEKGLLLGEKKIYDQCLLKRIQFMEDMATKYGLELSFSQTQDSQSSVLTGYMGTQQSGSISQRTSVTDASVHLTEEDLQAFNNSVQAKREELQKHLELHINCCQNEEDKIQSELGTLTAERLSKENDLARYQAERKAAVGEIQKMVRGVISSRIRKSDIDDARHQVEKYAKIRDECNDDPRRKKIPLEIKDKEGIILKIKSEIYEDNLTLKDLRQCAEVLNSIAILKRQIKKDMELIEEMKIDAEEKDFLTKYGMQMNTDHEDINFASDNMVSEVVLKLEAHQSGSDQNNTDLKAFASQVAKKSALLNHNKQTLKQRKEHYAVLIGEGRGVQRIKNIIKCLRQFEQKNFGNIISLEIEPQELLNFLTKRIGEESICEEKNGVIVWTLKRLHNLADIKDDEGNPLKIVCPCCGRKLKEDEEIETFENSLKELQDPEHSSLLMKPTEVEFSRSALQNYETWRNSVSQSINDWLDYKRVSSEIKIVEETIVKEEEELESLKAKHSDVSQKNNTLKVECLELQELHDIAKQFRNDARKVSEKKARISEGENELSMIAPTANGKDLPTLERELSSKHEDKDLLTNGISSLNKELSDLNSRISRASNQASKAEKNVRDKEEKYAQEQKAVTKKQELNNAINDCKKMEEKLQTEIAPIRSKEKAKETVKNRYRVTSKATEQELSSKLSVFDKDSNNVTAISKQIDEFLSSDKLQSLQGIDSNLNSVLEDLQRQERELHDCEPELEDLKTRTGDQGGHEQNVRHNIELLHTIINCENLEAELELIEEKRDEIKDVENAANELDSSMKNIRSYECEKKRREGSLDTLKVQQRELKRKLKSEEYHNIDERYRVKMIENETCVMTVLDLDLYYSALDKALLRYHGMKIEEINKIIQELWSLTYKGEDITSIRLTSDQESGSRATRSYNYRVVMTKGTTELDMRGRCSAGQRVLASIVIRLALAETFCLNCGVMALDEPTTNLDYANKRGLAVALAQIIASRAAQENFQLVTITHDEDFVNMLKNELATHTGFNMPERFFQVSREEGSDGSYYSKIHAIDWDEL